VSGLLGDSLPASSPRTAWVCSPGCSGLRSGTPGSEVSWRFQGSRSTSSSIWGSLV